MKRRNAGRAIVTAIAAFALAFMASTASAEKKKPNILIIWGDDIGIFNVGAYNLGMMGYKTPNNIDRIQQATTGYSGQGAPLTAEELQQLLAPVALYPDSLGCLRRLSG